MTRAAVPVLAWAAFLTLLAAVLLVWTPHAELQWGPLAAAAGATWLLGAVLLARGRRREGFLAERSYGTLTAAVGIAAAFAGGVFGLWVTLVGCGLIVLGIVLVHREREAAP